MNKEKKAQELRDFNIPYRNTLNLSENVRFGVEVEFKMHGYNDSYISNFPSQFSAAREILTNRGYNFSYIIKSELENQIELVSTVLKDDERCWNELDSILNFVEKSGGYCSNESGAHVHICKNIFNDNHMGWLNFFKLWCVFEDVIFTFTNGKQNYLRETGNSYASRINNICRKIVNDYNFINIIDVSCLTRLKHNCINFNSILYDSTGVYKDVHDIDEFNKSKTIEFRSPNGTLDKTIFQNDVNFFAKTLLSCSDINFDIEKLDYLYNHKLSADELDLVEFVFKDELDKNCFLKQFYKI